MFLKKLASLSFALALVYSISLPAHADLLKNFKTDGSIEVKSYGIDNETDFNGLADDYHSRTRTRVFLGGSFDLLDDVHARILLRKNNRVYNSGGANTSEDLNTVQSNVRADNAYVKVDKVFDRVDLTMGRQFYGSSDDLLIYFGPQPDDILSVTAMDNFRADAVIGFAKVQAIYGKIADTGVIGSNSDTNVWGVEANTDKIIPKGVLGVGYYTQQTKKAAGGLNGTDNDTLNSAEVKLNGALPLGLSYAAQLVQNFGHNTGSTTPPASDENDGTAYILGVKGNPNLGMPLRVMAEYGRGTGNFQSIAAGKRFGKIWGQHTTSATAPSMRNNRNGAGLTNLKVWDLGLGTTVSKLGFDVAYYRFMYDDANQTNSGLTSAGSEFDFIVSHKHSDNVSFEVSFARFLVGDANDNAPGTPTNSVDRLGADVKIKF